MMYRALGRKVQSSATLQIARHVAVKCTAAEALVETLVRHKVKNVFGIVGSAFIDPLDLFPDAGIDFIDVTHVRIVTCASPKGLLILNYKYH